MNKELKFLQVVLFVFLFLNANTQISICSWNLKDFGKSKSDTEIEFIANTIKQFDIIAIQEVVAGFGGPQAVTRLVDYLNRKGSKWDYVVSDPTSSSAYKAERYAYVWKTAKVTKKGSAWLEEKYGLEIDREPFYLTFNYNRKTITLVNFHAITKSRQPEREVKYFKFLTASYPGKNLIFLGDFNLPQPHSVFNPIKSLGYTPLLTGQKTSLRQKCISEECLASEFDNMFFSSVKYSVIARGIVPFYNKIENFSEARLISDHVPIFARLKLN